MIRFALLYIAMFCIALDCLVMICNGLHCFALHWFALRCLLCIVLFCSGQFGFALFCFDMHCIDFFCFAFLCFDLLCRNELVLLCVVCFALLKYARHFHVGSRKEMSHVFLLDLIYAYESTHLRDCIYAATYVWRPRHACAYVSREKGSDFTYNGIYLFWVVLRHFDLYRVS